MSVQALFVDPSGIYPKLLGFDRCWTFERDARKYAGPDPVVAHPPCQLWVNMAAVNWKRYGRQRPAWYPGGDDGGCFASALESVRTFGGVLEHPASSHAWEHHGLLRPITATVPDFSGGCSPRLGHGWRPFLAGTGVEYWVCEVWQSAYGHAARKRTWLLYCGKRPPLGMAWGRDAPTTHQVGWFDRNKPTLSKRDASATPRAFAEALIELVAWSRGEPHDKYAGKPDHCVRGWSPE